MAAETFFLNDVEKELSLTEHQLRHRRQRIRDILEGHEWHTANNRVLIDKAGLEILKKANELYEKGIPYQSKDESVTPIPKHLEFRKAVKEIEEKYGAEVTIEKGAEDKTKLEQLKEAVKKIKELEQKLESERNKTARLKTELHESREKIEFFYGELEIKGQELETQKKQKQLMDAVRDSIIAKLVITDAIDKEGLETILTAINTLEEAVIPRKKRAGLTPK